MSGHSHAANIAAKKAKTEGLTPEEVEERRILREEYLAGFRKNFVSNLSQIQIVEPDGSITPVVPKSKKTRKN